MREPVVVTGVVLLAAPMGEYDKRLVILSRERGKITVFARGARKPNSSMLAATNPFVFGTFSLYEGKTAYSMIQVSVQNYFTELAMQQPEVYYGFYFLEFAEYYSNENADESASINLLYVALRALQNENIDNRLIRYVFELRLMAMNGEFGIIEENIKDESVLYTLQYIVYSPFTKLFHFQVTDTVLHQIKKTSESYFHHNVDRSFKSLKILEMMESQG